MCGIVGVIGVASGGAADAGCAAPAGISRLRQRRHRHPGERPHRAPPRRGQARQSRRRAGSRRRWPAPPASATRAGRRMARRPRATRIRTAPRASPSCTTASSRTTPNCAPSWRPRGRSSPPRPTPRRWRSWSICNLQRGMDPVAAAGAAFRRLEGAYALAMIFAGHPELIVGAQHGAPLAVGFGEDEMFVGSDGAGAGAADPAHRLSERRRLDRGGPQGRALLRRRRHRGAARGEADAADRLGDRQGQFPPLHGKGAARASGGDRRHAASHGQSRRRARSRCPRCRSTSPRCRASPSAPAAARSMPAWSAAGGSRRSRASRPMAMSPASSAIARRRWRRAGSACWSASRARPPTPWRRCATCASRGSTCCRSSTCRKAAWRAHRTPCWRRWPGRRSSVASTKAFTAQLSVLACLALAAGARARRDLGRRRRRR